MTRSRGRFLATLVLLLGLWTRVLASEARQVPEEPPWEWNGAPRVVAIGDVHGAYDNLVAILKNAGLIDEKLRWIGGKAHLVQNGDIVDRGPHSRKAMDLLMELEKQAEKAGGRVHVLVGNHEAMNIVGILDLVSDEEIQSYVNRDSRRLRDAAFERYYEERRKDAKEKKETLPEKSALKADFETKYPLGVLEHRQAFSASGRYGKWLRGKNASIRVNGIVFSHGDWSEGMAELGIAEVNRRVRAELSDQAPLEGGVAFDSSSPLQYRGLAHVALTSAAQQAEAPRVARILASLGATRMVVGHTLTSGVIESRFGGKHISIDTGMLELYRGGHRIALQIEGSALSAIHDRGLVPIPDTMDEKNFSSYVLEVAKVDPENLDVQLRRVDMLHEQGRADEAASALEKLLSNLNPDFVPFRYREQLGSYYGAKGEEGRAREHYLAYIDGLSKLIAQSPENLNLRNLLARFCIEKGLELDRAEAEITAALEQSPSTPSYLLTRARLHIVRSQFREALSVLESLSADGGLEYDIHYYRGLAYLGVDDRERARAAFEAALATEPNRPEAREEIRKLDQVPLFR
jgi:tetratricopeptide (TPR) repeat protein